MESTRPSEHPERERDGSGIPRARPNASVPSTDAAAAAAAIAAAAAAAAEMQP
jgi:hypothetical protein